MTVDECKYPKCEPPQCDCGILYIYRPHTGCVRVQAKPDEKNLEKLSGIKRNDVFSCNDGSKIPLESVFYCQIVLEERLKMRWNTKKFY